MPPLTQSLEQLPTASHFPTTHHRSQGALIVDPTQQCRSGLKVTQHLSNGHALTTTINHPKTMAMKNTNANRS
eukprot:1488016-Amphidinium_carterae.1